MHKGKSMLKVWNIWACAKYMQFTHFLTWDQLETDIEDTSQIASTDDAMNVVT